MSSKLQLILTTFNNWQNETEREDYISALEEQIELMNEQARQGITQYADSVYDACMELLREVKPDSYLLHQVWSGDEKEELDEEIDKYLSVYPMLSIQTVKHISDKPVSRFKEMLPSGYIQFIAAMKENGHGVRVVYNDGYIVEATSRGRSTAGKDLTRQAKIILGEYNEEFLSLGLVELRGEALLPFNNLDRAREFNPEIKSAFTGVSSMIRASATEEETKLLDIVFYDILCDKVEFETLSGKYEFLTECGYIVPYYKIFTASASNLEDTIDTLLDDMDIETSHYEYYTDGIVFSVDELELFHSMGAEDKFRLGNLALKMGRWAQDGYTGIISHIDWTEGKSRKTPVAVLEEPVLTATGSSVTNIPLYAPLYILTLEAYPGNVIHFKFGGEAGVIPTFPDGRLVTDKLE